MVHSYGEQEIGDLIASIGSFDICRVISQRIASTTVAAKERKSGECFVIKLLGSHKNRRNRDHAPGANAGDPKQRVVHDDTQSEEEDTDAPTLLAKCTKLKALAKILAKAPHIVVQEAVVRSGSCIIAKRPYFYQNLFERLRAASLPSHSDRVWIAFQLVRAIEEVHGKECFHGSLSLDSIYVTEYDWLVITDFDPDQYSGESTSLLINSAAAFVKPRQIASLASEVFTQSISSRDRQKSDIFSVGSLLYTIFTGIILHRKSPRSAVDLRAIRLIMSNKAVPERLSVMIVKMLGENASERPTILDVAQECRDYLFPGIYRGYLHPYLSLLPILLDNYTENRIVDTITKLSEDIEDVVFMLLTDEVPKKYPDLVIERLLLHLAKYAPLGAHQVISLKTIRFLNGYWTVDQYVREIFPKLLSLYDGLSVDAKLELFEIIQSQKPAEDLLTLYSAYCLYEKVGKDVHTMVRTAGMRLLCFLVPENLSLNIAGDGHSVTYNRILDEMQCACFNFRTSSISLNLPGKVFSWLELLHIYSATALDYSARKLCLEIALCKNIEVDSAQNEGVIIKFLELFTEAPCSQLLDLQLKCAASAMRLRNDCTDFIFIRFNHLALCGTVHYSESVRAASNIYMTASSLEYVGLKLLNSNPVSADYFLLCVNLQSRLEWNPIDWDLMISKFKSRAAVGAKYISDRDKCELMFPVIIADGIVASRRARSIFETISESSHEEMGSIVGAV